MRVGLARPGLRLPDRAARPRHGLPDPVRASREVLHQSVRASVLSTADVLEGMTRTVDTNVTAEAYARLNDLWPQQRRLIKAGLSST